MAMTVESHVVLCGHCQRTRVVAVSDLRPPCFRNIEEQADCPEVLQRRGSGDDEALMTMMCGALAESFAENLKRAAVEAVNRDGDWQIACRIPGDPDRYYSSDQARRQAETWRRHGRSGLARRLSDAAAEVDQASRSRARIRRLVPILALGIVIAAVGVVRQLPARFMRLSGEGAAQAAVEQQSVAIRIPAPAPRPAPPDSPSPQLAVLEPVASPSPAAVTSAEEAPVPEASPSALPTSWTEQTPTTPSAKALASAASAAINAAIASQAAPPEPALEPEMVSLPGDTFTMGSNFDPTEAPIHTVSVKPFAISKAVITVRAWNRCVAAKACPPLTADESDNAPITNVSFDDVQLFVAWLSQETRKSFRLPTESEWEYAARGGTRTKYWWGNDIQPAMVNCKGCSSEQTPRPAANVEEFKPNPFGLHDMGGNVAQWVSDCWHKNYQGAVADGSAWMGDANRCVFHVIRSGSWRNSPNDVRPSSRDYYDGRIRYPTHGFRVARSIQP
jgi:formylglycine-generating enzyme required for sulfatase activity